MRDIKQTANVMQTRYPHLFREVIWPWGPTQARFELMETAPPGHLIANVNVVPQVGDRWLILKLQDGSWEIPGGTLEPGETYLKTARRELLEEAGARLITFQLFGAWHCYSQAAKPYRPHVPFPEFYRLVGIGAVEVVQSPENPTDGEQVVRVEAVSLEMAVERFTTIGRHDLAELYRLAADIATAC